MRELTVQLAERSYPILIGTELLDRFGATVPNQLPAWKHAFLISDERIMDQHCKPLEAALQAAGIRTSLAAVPSGEGSKSIDQLASLWNQMLAAKTDRKSVVVAVGGGVIGDLAGFAAASYSRGIRFIQVPTTLLAMVDSSVGGKTGINLVGAKNIVGAFWQPQLVWIDTHTLSTLPEREFLSGLAEIVKYGVILDAAFFEYLETHRDRILQREPAVIEQLIYRSCELKAQVVSQDERETTGLRAILNYGHTFGHAIEAVTAYGRYLHGEAISIGMTMAATLAQTLGHWPAESTSRQTKLLEYLGLPTQISDVDAITILDAMQADKKTEHGKLHLILPARIGHVATYAHASRSAILAAIQSCQ